jgi:hypothetical protein
MYPEGRIWNSAELVVRMTGPPGLTSTLICYGLDGGSVFAGGGVQLAIRRHTPASSIQAARVRAEKISPDFIAPLP